MGRVRQEQGYKKPEQEPDFQSKVPVLVKSNQIFKISIQFRLKPNQIFKKAIQLWFKQTGILVRTGFYLCSFHSGQQEKIWNLHGCQMAKFLWIYADPPPLKTKKGGLGVPKARV